MTSPVYATVQVYTGQATLYKVPETQLCLTGHSVVQGMIALTRVGQL